MNPHGAHRDLTDRIIRCAVDVHQELGPGLFESVYEVCLADVLREQELFVERQVRLPITFRGRLLEDGFRVDLIVDRKIIVEIKSVKSFDPVHRLQLHTYLRLAGIEVGLLINFNKQRVVDGVRRIANGAWECGDS